MFNKPKISEEEKLSAVKECLSGFASEREVAKKYNVHPSSLTAWLRLYEVFGETGLYPKRNSTYSREQRANAVGMYLKGEASLNEVCKVHKITSTSVLRRWISWHNEECIKMTRSTSNMPMLKGRKTTQEERVEIVAFCIENSSDYYAAAEKYKVSYQQVYSWVKKFESRGIDGLVDGRGRTKPESELSESNKLKAENRLLEAKNKDLEIENEFLKKVRSLKGGGLLAE